VAEPTGIPAFDLTAPTNLLVPTWDKTLQHALRMPTGFDEAKARREAQERQARVERELAEARDEWRQYFDRHYANRLARAAFDIHQPEARYDCVVCSECEEHNGYEDTQQVAWPCRTYAAMKEAADA